MRKLTFLLIFVTLSFCTGCLGDPVMLRRLSIGQNASTDNSAGDTFDIDISAIPEGWIIKRTNEDSRYGTVTKIEIAQEHRVKILIIPVRTAQELSP
jgi:hypothetical protein